jgi:hypothetical protein
MDAKPPDHNIVLADAAKAVLAPMGLVRKGRSRTWLDDRIWHLIVVEFQPSAWSKGSYLNVGAMWLWYEKDHFSFDHGYRVQEFESAGSLDWSARSRALAEAAAKRVGELREEISDLAAADQVLREGRRKVGWPLFDAAVAAGLVGDTDAAREAMDRLLSHEPSSPWQHAQHTRMAEFRSALHDRDAYRARIIEAITRSREAHKLPVCSAEQIGSSLDFRAERGVGATVRRRLGQLLDG